MNDFAILAQLDFMRFRNSILSIFHSRGRIFIWGMYILWIGGMLVGRLISHPDPHPLHGPSHHLSQFAANIYIAEPISSMIAFSFLVFTAIMLIQAAGGQGGAFASKADARFLTFSHLNPRNVAMWIELRQSLKTIIRFFFAIVFYATIINRSGSFSGTSLTMAGASAFLGCLAIPGLAAGKRFGQAFTWTLIGIAAMSCVAIIGLALAYMPALGLLSIPNSIETFHFGRIVKSMLGGDLLPIGLLMASTAALIVIAYRSARDLYPELYAASMANFERVQKRSVSGRGGTNSKYRLDKIGSNKTVFSGAWTIIWKEWIGFSRSKTAHLTVAAASLGIFMSGILGLFMRMGVIDSSFILALSGPALSFMLIFMMTTGVSLANDLRKPLWWFGPESIRIRLLAWLYSTTWRLSLTLIVSGVLFSIASNRLMVIPWLIPLALVVPLTLRVIALTTYAILPAPVDQRGPLALLRIIIIFILVFIPITSFIASTLMFHNQAIALSTVIVVTILQILALVDFSGWRMNGSGASFALAEQS